MAWYEELFSEDYLRLYGPLHKPEQTAREVDFLQEVLGLKPGSRVLDLCCGQGRHSVELARRGFQVTGYDLSECLLLEAGQVAAARGVHITWVRGDMRDLSFHQEFDAALNMFTSFGYFEDERENQEVLQGVARALRRGGRFAIDVANRDWAVANMPPRTWMEGEDYLYLQTSEFDLLGSRGVTRHIFVDRRAGNERRETSCALRLYSAHELIRMIEDAGMKVVSTHGALAINVPLTAEATRLVVVAERP